MVAPGMDCRVTVSFNPDTRGSYEDEVCAISDTVQFQVPLRAQLPPPSLSLPRVLDVGLVARSN